MTTIVGGLIGLPALVGFGNSAQGLTILGGTLNTLGLQNMAFSMPRNGTLSSLAVYFSTTVALGLIGSTVTLRTQLYQSTSPNDVFTPIPGALVDFALTGLINIGTTFSGIVTGLGTAVAANTRLLLVVSASSTGLSLINTVTGHLSAGLAIV